MVAESAAEALWPRATPEEGLRSLQVTVSRLRRSLGEAGTALETVAPGYRLAIEPDAIDARRFEAMLTEGRAARVAGDAKGARRLLDDALALWRGPPLADAGFESFAQGEIARLEELRVAALEERIDARLSEGEHALVVAELEQLAAEHPSRERLVELLMLALYRCGRQTDALDVYTRGRIRLDEEVGLEPSPELQRLQEAILRQDRSLEAHADEPLPERGPEPAAPALPAQLAPLPAMPFVGRTAELARLDRAARPGAHGRAAARARGRRAGERQDAAGEGARRAGHRRAAMHVLYGACDPAVRTPYQPLRRGARAGPRNAASRRARAERRRLPGVVDPLAAWPARRSRRPGGGDRRRARPRIPMPSVTSCTQR